MAENKSKTNTTQTNTKTKVKSTKVNSTGTAPAPPRAARRTGRPCRWSTSPSAPSPRPRMP